MSWLPVFESVARVAIAILINGLWQGALIAFVTWLALRIFGGANASTRYAVWAIALCAVVIVPVATSLSRVSVVTATANSSTSWQPSGQITGTKATHTSAAAVPPAHESAASRASSASSASASLPAPAGNASPLRSVRVQLPTIVAAVLFGLWLAASLVVLARLAIALVALERLKRDALPLGVDYRDSMPRWDAALKGNRDVRLCVSDDIEVPVAIGLFDAMILLPSHLVQSLDPSEVDQISLHELAHLLRSDDWTNGLQRVASALLFFNPAVWFIARQLDIEREVACDDFVLQLTGAVRPYAFCLTKMAEMTAWPHRAVPAPGVFVTRKNISIRIERLLRTGRAIGSSIAPGIAASVSVALLAIFFVLRTMTPSIAFTQGEAPQPPAAPWTPAQHVARTATAPHVSHPAVHNSPAAHALHPAAPAAPPATREKAATIPSGLEPVAAMPAVLPSVHSLVAQALVAHHVAQLVHDTVQQSMHAGVTHTEHGDCVGCEYANANLQNKDFSDRSLEGSNFAHANLQGARFDHASLTGVNFKDADLRNASFAGADLEGCNMRGAQLAGARFDGAQLTGCNIDASMLSPEQARIVLNACEGCNFEHVNLRGMDLHDVHLEGVNMAYADLRGANLSGAMFTGVNFGHAQFGGARVDDADFTGCNFNGADLRNVDLSKASITGSAMSGAIMRV